MVARSLVTLALIALPAAAHATNAWDRDFVVGARPHLRLKTGDGAVVVRPGTKGIIRAHVRVDGYTIGRDLTIRAEQRGNDVEIVIDVKPRFLDWGHRSIRVELFTPSEIALDVSTGDGSVVAEGLSGDITLSTGDGRVRVRDTRGAIEIHTGDGGVTAEGVDGTLDLTTGDGPVEVNGRFDALQVETGDGGVTVQAQAGSRLNEPWSISTGDGHVRLAVGRDLAAELYVHTGDGDIDVDAQIDLSGGLRRHELRGTLNGGGRQLKVVTGDGTVRVTQAR